MKLDSTSRVIITGGGSGLGRELCLTLARRGARLWVTDVSLPAAEETANSCRQLGASDVRSFECDVRKPDNFEVLSSLAMKEWGGVDLLVNNAGVALGGQFESYSLEDWHWVIDTNLWGVIHGCHTFYPLMKNAGKGAILNIASAAGLVCPPRMSAYNTSKAAVIALSETLRAESAGTGVNVSVVCPTFFKSGLFERSRFSTPEIRNLSRKLFDWSGCSVQDVVQSCVRGVESGSFYVLPMREGWILWWIKRAAPNLLGWFWGKLHGRI